MRKKISSNLKAKKFSHFKKIIKSHEIFNKSSRLSLKSDRFILFEYIEKYPLILSNFGMCSWLERWIYLTWLAMKILKDNNYVPNKG